MGLVAWTLDAGAAANSLGPVANRVCPWWMGYLLACPLRRWVHDPAGIVGPFVSEGMIVLEPGPGMGFFTLELARRVGPKGRVIAVDVQAQMLERLVRRAQKVDLADRLDARLAKGDSLGIEDYAQRVDFALAFAMVHEVSNPRSFFKELSNVVKAGAKLLIAEPKGHVSTEKFKGTLAFAEEVGFHLESQPEIRRSHAALLVRC